MNARNFIPLLASFLCLAAAAQAGDVQLMGLASGKAIFSVAGGKVRTLREGESSPEGVRLISADRRQAVIELGGERQVLTLGGGVYRAPGPDVEPAGGASTAMITADAKGHFFANGTVNGAAVRFLVDTGATAVTLSAEQAKSIGVNYLAGTRGFASTANGAVPVYRVKLDEVRVGEVVLRNVDALVQPGDGLPIALLGMSFLNRVDMRRQGDSLVLMRRY